MRIAVVGKWHKYNSYFLHGTLEGAIQNGHSAAGFEFISIEPALLKSSLTDYRPDFIFCHMLFSGEGSPVEKKLEIMRAVKRDTGAKVVYQMGDPRLIPRYSGDLKGTVDYIAIAHEDWADFGKLGIPLIFWPYGCLKRDYFPDRKQIKYPLAFAGTYPSTNYLYDERTRLITRLKESDLLTAFPQKGGKNTMFITHELASVTGAFVNVLGRHDIKNFFSLRPFQFIGAGCLSIQKTMNGLDQVFADKKHHLVFKDFDPQEVIGLYNHYILKYPEEGEAIRKAGFEFCQKNHNYRVRIKDFLDVVDGKKERVRYKKEDFK